MDTSPRPTATRTPPNRRRVAAAAALASAAEWYDYFVFGIAAALIFGKQYFPAFSPAAGVLASFATFAVGFFARPLGGTVAGTLGDRYGRKPVLVAALVVAGLATSGIGALPNYASIGVAAPVLLVLLRLLQGLAVGAQWGGAMLLATEYAPERRRGFYGSLVQMGVPIGVVLANTAFLLVQAVFPASSFGTWAWRVPFLVGLLVVALAWYIHVNVEETPEFRDAAASSTAERNSPLRQVLRHHLSTVLLAAGSFTVNPATFYILITGILDYATRQLHMARGPVLTVVLVVSLTQLVTIPVAAALSDRIGRLKVYTFGTVGLLVWAVPLFLLIDSRSLIGYIIGTLIGSTFLSIMYGPQAALFAELFTPEMRYTGASLGYQISAVCGGGLAPMIMVLLLDSTKTSLSVSYYLMALAVVALACIAVLARRAPAVEARPDTGARPIAETA